MTATISSCLPKSAKRSAAGISSTPPAAASCPPADEAVRGRLKVLRSLPIHGAWNFSLAAPRFGIGFGYGGGGGGGGGRGGGGGGRARGAGAHRRHVA